MFFKRASKAGRILVIEDDWDILEVLKLLLEYEGHAVTTAKHGREALATIEASAKPFDLVVMDISMPEMSGIEVAQTLRGNPKTADMRIAIHTGLDERWVHERFADYDLFLTKAADADILVDKIAKLLAQPKVARQAAAAAPSEADSVFSTEDVALARRALRESMGLGEEALTQAAFLALLDDEIQQLRKIGKSDAQIAADIGAVVKKPVVIDGAGLLAAD